MSAAKQPWSIGIICLDDSFVTAVLDCDGDEICNMGNSLMDEGANAERIVACVNDYAALVARCAGLEQERDAAPSYKRESDMFQRRCAYLAGQLGETDALLGRLVAERDALQANLAAAEEALRKAESWTDHIHTALAESLRPKQAVGEMVYGLLDFLRAILAGHAPATPRPGHIGDATEMVQAAPNDRERRLRAALDRIVGLDVRGDDESNNCEAWGMHLEEAVGIARAALADTTNNDGDITS